MAVHYNSEQRALERHLDRASPSRLANFIESNSAVQKDLVKKYEGLHLPQLLKILRSGDDDQIDVARNYFNRYLQSKHGQLPYYGGKIPLPVRFDAARLETIENVSSFLKNSKRAVERAVRLNPLAFWPATKALTDAIVTPLSAMGLTIRERKLAIANISGLSIAYSLGLAPTIVGTAFMAAGSIPSEASLPQADESLTADNGAYTQILSGTHRPLETTVSPLAYQRPGDAGKLTKLFEQFDTQTPVTDSQHLLSPYLVKAIQDDPQKREYFNMVTEEARKQGIDEVLFANQIFRESVHFDSDVINGTEKSHAGAVGIAQFMPATAREHFNLEVEDLTDPAKAIPAAARYMKNLTDKNGGDQILAMIEYNGGQGAINFLHGKLGKNITGLEAMKFLEERFEKLGNTSPSAYHVETRKYVADITGYGWKADYLSWATSMNEKLYGERRNLVAYNAPVPKGRPARKNDERSPDFL